MNHLGILLTWSALQTTLLALAATTAYLFAARRKPTVGAAVAAAGPCGAVLLTLLTVCPPPAWWNWRSLEEVRPATAGATHADIPSDAEPSSPEVKEVAPAPPSSGGAALAWPVVLGRWTWEGAGRTSSPFTNQSGNGWEIAAIVFLSGAALCVFRLAVGLWAVSDLRRRSRPITGSSVGQQLDQLRLEMGCRRRVEIRESPRVGAPAVVGWLRLTVLLPPDWREWSDAERRAVLAHELAHIRRADYLLGLLARLGVALHFYHPLLYWLVGRLRLQQELAADALAAPFAGGRPAYLLALAGLALRLQGRRLACWPANPMFTRGTLMRRISMLKTKDGPCHKPISHGERLLIAALLAIAIVGVSALRCPVQKGEAKPAGERVKETEKPSKEAAAPALEVEPVDLSYISPDGMGVVAFRPVMFGRPNLKKYAEAFNKAFAGYCTAAGLPRSLNLPLEEIAQVSATIRIGTTTTAGVTRNTLTFGAPALIRSVNDFDWGKELKELVPGVTETEHGGRVIYKLPTDGPLGPILGAKQICFYTPDGRTAVFDTKEGLAQWIDRKPGGAALPWAADWQRVERGVLAVVLDNRNGALSRELAARDNPEAIIAPFQKHALWSVFGVGAEKDLVCDASIHFDGEEPAEKAVKEIDGQLAAARDALASPAVLQVAGEGPEADSFSISQLTAFQLLKNLLRDPNLRREKDAVRLRCRVRCDITEVLAAIFRRGTRTVCAREASRRGENDSFPRRDALRTGQVVGDAAA